MQNIEIGLGTFVAASALADRFDLAAGKAGRQKVAETLEQAIDFIDSTLPQLADGWQLVTGNPYDWDIPVLNTVIGKDIGARGIVGDEQGMTTPVQIDDEAFSKAGAIRKAFNLASEEQVAALAIDVYRHLKDGLWRGNGFSYERNGDHADFDEKRYMPKPR